MAVRTKNRSSSSNRVGMAVIAGIVVILIVSLLVLSDRLNKKIASHEASNEALELQIREEEDRAKELEKLPDYIKSDEYIEKAAREKFGLVYDDEVVFKQED